MTIVRRGVVGALAVLLLTPTILLAQAPDELSLAAARSLATSQNPTVLAALLAADSTSELTEVAGRWPNPEMLVYQENFPGALPDSDQWIVTLSQRIPIGGRTGAAQAQAEALQAAVTEDVAAVRWRTDLRVRTEYGAAYARQRELEVVRTAADATRELLGDLQARRAEGDASEFEVLRIAREVEGLEARAATLRSELRGAEIRLAVLMGVRVPAGGWVFRDPAGQEGGPPPLAAAAEGEDVEPAAVAGAAAPAAGEEETPAEFAARPDIAAARRRTEAAEAARVRERKTGVPDLVVTAGYTRLDPGFDGFTWSVGAQLPIFNSNREQVALRSIEKAELEREVVRLQMDARAERDAAREAYRSATAQLQRLQSTGGQSLAGIARAGYEEGEMTVTELVDALRADLAATQRRLELAERRSLSWFVWQWSEGDGRQRGER